MLHPRAHRRLRPVYQRIQFRPMIPVTPLQQVRMYQPITWWKRTPSQFSARIYQKLEKLCASLQPATLYRSFKATHAMIKWITGVSAWRKFYRGTLSLTTLAIISIYFLVGCCAPGEYPLLWPEDCQYHYDFVTLLIRKCVKTNLWLESSHDSCYNHSSCYSYGNANQ